MYKYEADKYKVTYLGYVDYFKSFKALKYYYNSKAKSLFALQEELKTDANGMEYPMIERI